MAWPTLRHDEGSHQCVLEISRFPLAKNAEQHPEDRPGRMLSAAATRRAKNETHELPKWIRRPFAMASLKGSAIKKPKKKDTERKLQACADGADPKFLLKESQGALNFG